jgi:hypothetical protein
MLPFYDNRGASKCDKYHDLQQNPLNTAAIGARDVIFHPVFPQQMARHFNHDVVGFDASVG